MRIGDIVHYRAYGTPGGEYLPQCRAAVVTETHPQNRVSIVVLNPKGIFLDPHVAHSPLDQSAGGTWHRREECDQ